MISYWLVNGCSIKGYAEKHNKTEELVKKELCSFIEGLNIAPEIKVDPVRLRLHVIKEMVKCEKRIGIKQGQFVQPTEEEDKSLATLPNESSSSSSSPNTSEDGNNGNDSNTEEPIADEGESGSKEEDDMSESRNDSAYMKMK